MEFPRSLPAQLYLLAYDRQKGRVRGSNLGHALRAAALVDLQMDGLVVDEGGKARVAPDARPPDDPVLAAVFSEVASGRPRSWTHWVEKSASKFRRIVRDELAAAGWLAVERRRILRIIPADDVRLRQEHVVSSYATELTMVVRRGQPVDRIDPRKRALVALAAIAGLPTLLSRADRKQYKVRLGEFADVLGPMARALRRAIQRAHAMAATVGAGAGWTSHAGP